MSVPDDRRYSDSHEWHKPDGNVVTVGITRFAIDELTDVTYVELPEIGTEVEAGGTIGEIESVKATSDLYSGVAGKIVEVNEAAVADPSILNQDCYEAGWLVKIEVVDGAAAVEPLMGAAAYSEKFSA